MSYVIAGASGQLGRLVTEGLLRQAPDEGVTALVRNPEKVSDLAALGVEVRIADYNDPETLRTVFRPDDKVLLVCGNEIGRRVAQHTSVIEAAARAQVAFLAYSEVVDCHEGDFVLAQDHFATEEVLRASGLPHIFVRNNLYNEEFAVVATDDALRTGELVGAWGEGRVACAARLDYAEATVAVLTDSDSIGRVFDLSGDTAWTMPEFAAELSTQTGRHIPYRPITQDQYRYELEKTGLDAALASVLADFQNAIAADRFAAPANDGTLARLIGRPTTPLPDTLRSHLAERPA